MILEEQTQLYCDVCSLIQERLDIEDITIYGITEGGATGSVCERLEEAVQYAFEVIKGGNEKDV